MDKLESSPKTGMNDIDRCILCWTKEPTSTESSLSTRLNARLINVIEALPDIEMVDPFEKVPAQRNKSIVTSKGCELPISTKAVTGGMQMTPVVNLSSVLGSQKGSNSNTLILPQLRRFFILKHVFEHPLDHPSIQKMMLLVQSPSDWCSICSSCLCQIDIGIVVIESIQTTNDGHKRKSYTNELAEIVEKLRKKLTDSYQRNTPPEERASE